MAAVTADSMPFGADMIGLVFHPYGVYGMMDDGKYKKLVGDRWGQATGALAMEDGSVLALHSMGMYKLS
eukprot:1174103-Amphidinium_carterae.1